MQVCKPPKNLRILLRPQEKHDISWLKKNTGGVKNTSDPSVLFSASTPPSPMGKVLSPSPKRLVSVWKGGGMTKNKKNGKILQNKKILYWKGYRKKYPEPKNILHNKIMPKKTCKKKFPPPHLPLHISKWCLPCKVLNVTKWKSITKWNQW